MASCKLHVTAALVVIFLSSSFTHPALTEREGDSIAHDDSQLDDVLVIDLLRADRVDGSYTSPTLDCGIVFNSTRDSLTVSTLNGSRLMAAEEKVGAVRLLALGGREFIQHREEVSTVRGGDTREEVVQEYAIPRHQGSFTGTQDDEKFVNLLEKLKKVDCSVHTRVMEKSMKHVLSEPATKLLHKAAIAMGKRGITGRDYPGALPLYLTAMRLDSHHPFPSDRSRRSVDYRSSHYSRVIHADGTKQSAQVCLTKCPPCEARDCLGMCGRGCSCWEWACGDCCFHTGCYHHDLCCRSRPSSLACWIPLDFDCEKKYICKNPF